MNEYQQQALDFLKETGTTFEIVYQYTGPYFDGDKEFRDVFRFTLTNAKGSYSSTFGDSIINTEKRGAAKEAVRYLPKAYDVLACLEKYDPDTFESWCNNYGYNDRPLSEYPAAMKIYQACVDQYRGLSRIFSEAQMDMLREIQ